ncbi:MAG TPA: hypothetical protein VG892_12450 [Terriglobales bacterium]|nr:hypothetical protein [Terriglobales bacterium]
MIRTVVLLLALMPVWCSAQSPAAEDPPAGPDYSGTYSFLSEGEFLQVNIDGAAVTGVVSRYGSRESDRGVFLDHLFQKASVQDKKLKFTTREVHGVRYEFSGAFKRGNAKAQETEGYYLLAGELREITTGADGKESSRSRQVEFMSLPVDVGNDAGADAGGDNGNAKQDPASGKPQHSNAPKNREKD